MKVLRIGLTLTLTALSAAALALPSFLPVFRSTYKAPANSALASSACITCHMTKSGGKLNPYGDSLKSAIKEAKADKLTADILKKVEALDSDKDGVKNVDEIKKGTLPGDAKSK